LPRFTAPDGTGLYYRDAGAGLPLLCLAGLTRNSGDFDHLAPHLPDALALLDHLGLAQAAVLGTSRGGLIGLWLAATAKGRLSGLALNDIGPVIEARGMAVIRSYLGRNPAQQTYEAAARVRAAQWTAFRDVPQARWLAEVRNHYAETAEGLVIRYDPRLRAAVLAAWDQPEPDLWPQFDAAAGLPLAAIRGADSDLFSRATLAEMARRRPDMIWAEVPGRGHVPFLDEPQALAALRRWLGALR
jgi:pimeloyl-ACP methyl ester carboxylesterase